MNLYLYVCIYVCLGWWNTRVGYDGKRHTKNKEILLNGIRSLKWNENNKVTFKYPNE